MIQFASGQEMENQWERLGDVTEGGMVNGNVSR